VHYPGTYAAGCYNRLRDDIGGQDAENESAVNLPNWLDLRFAVDDGEWVDLSRVHVLGHRVTLDLRRGILSRQLCFTDAAGRTTSVRQRRFVHMARPHLAGLHTVFTAEDWTGRLRIASGIDGTVTNSGVPRYRGMADRHLGVVRTAELDPRTIFLLARTVHSEIGIAEAARTTVDPDGAAGGAHRKLWKEPGRIAHELELELRAGEPVAVAAALATHTACPVVVVHGRTPDAPAPGRRAGGGRCGRVTGQ
jgi:trehalose/maltose hydrolase-like predicted phosphorylase